MIVAITQQRTPIWVYVLFALNGILAFLIPLVFIVSVGIAVYIGIKWRPLLKLYIGFMVVGLAITALGALAGTATAVRL